MRVLLQSRVDLFDVTGGDTQQVKELHNSLNRLGIEANISTELEPDLSRYDLVHIFNITRIHDSLVQSLNATKQGKPIVLSPIHHKLAEINNYERYGRTGVLSFVNHFFRSVNQREYIKSVARFIKDPRQRRAIWKMWEVGFRNSQNLVLELSKVWAVLAEAEASQIELDFGIKRRHFVTPNGVNAAELNKSKEFPKQLINIKKYVLSVGRIEDRKNQLNLIKALEGTGLTLVLVGSVNSNHRPYWSEIKKEIKNKEWVIYLGQVEHKMLGQIYSHAKVHALPSWYEVVSLSTLEASLMGCNIVTSDRGYIREFLGDLAWYSQPDDINSIRSAVVQAFNSPQSGKLIPRIKGLTWENSARETIKAYKAALLND